MRPAAVAYSHYSQTQCFPTDRIEVREVHKSVVWYVFASRGCLHKLGAYLVLHVLVFGQELKGPRKGI